MMSEREFDRRLQEIEGHYDARREGAEALRDQEVSRLFNECGWTQSLIAKKMGRTQGWVQLRLKLGRFLAWLAINTDRINPSPPPESLTEWRFLRRLEQGRQGPSQGD